jgi:UDP-GlcNAc:undecaprenyl-phosphate/decaprenyl-phosphate GlcNAc-1-phosphate transferase
VLLSTPALIKVAYMKRLVDMPDESRKLHSRIIPSIGGIMIFAGTLFAYFLWYPFKSITDYGQLIRAIEDFKYVGACMLMLFFIGVKDDIIGTAPVKKLAGHLIVAFILVIMANVRITSMYGLFGVYELDEWVSIFLSVFTYTVIVNAINLIDGVDGLAAGVGAIICTSFGTWFYMAGGIEYATLAFALAGALVGFLFFNFSPAKIFMGDSGSLTIGLIISVLSIKLIEFDRSELPSELIGISVPVFVMATLVYPLIDTLRIFIYRAVKGVSPFAADRNHIHHRLLDLGIGQVKTVILLYLFTISIIVLSLMLDVSPSMQLVICASTAFVLTQIPIFILKFKNKGKSNQQS